ncbi:MAG: flagellar hook-basal body complex protein [Chitinivibrionales bacterium]|nr:flagellar hook-basal body complex protein [Chitinivibrionales bacterium]MBD3394020.1 flagellar hook-basal body complex protein [Chitinivibrionales bacterium]
MVRSLYSGISGLRNHQVGLDVTGNNIANVNTIGFKAGRITFEESMNQLLRGATRPPGNAGGTNPVQIGLGMSIGSIDTVLTQGNLQSTGQITDLALEGRSYFAYSNGTGNFFSRNGALQMDQNGQLVSPTNGFVLQGMMAAADGTYPPGTTIGNLRIPYGEKAPANATTEVFYSSNLDSDSEGLGTVIHSNRYLAAARDMNGAQDTTPLMDTTLTSLYDENGNSLGIRVGDTITITAYNATAGTDITPVSFTVDETTDLQDLIDEIQINALGQIDGAITVGVNADGSLTVDTTLASTDAANLTVSSNRPGSNSFVTNMFTFAPNMPQGSTYDSAGSLRRPANALDELNDLYDAGGTALGLEDGDEIRVNGAVGGRPVTTGTLAYSLGAGTDTTMQELIDLVRQTFSLPATDGTQQDNASVEIDPPDTRDNRITDGSLVVRGQPEEAFALSNVTVTATNSDNDQTAPLRFTANNTMVEIQAARDTGVHSTSIVVYDAAGDAHTMTTTYTHSGTPNEWLWEITMAGGEQIIGGNMGRITFGQDGSPSSFSFDDGATTFRFNPMNGSNEVSIRLDIGSPGEFTGITQFRSESTTAARDQDGYPMGKLQEVSIDEFGEISGIYTNGVNKSIARIYVADFNNPAGLQKLGDSMYGISNNSGEPVYQQPGVGTSTKIKPGAVEMSNVELATEFTNMITIQRGYQSNARVITTSDTLLNELVQLVR